MAMSNDDFIKSGGYACPDCGHDPEGLSHMSVEDITIDDVDVVCVPDDVSMLQAQAHVFCSKCGAGWWVIFHLAGYCELKTGAEYDAEDEEVYAAQNAAIDAEIEAELKAEEGL